ncbi:2-deoxyribose-5-phosphate aldolase [Niastella vici]|uniref:Deoxyribose-phosphate aldolase n=1 Tax=Niastella vici TaxID=1703345 RepID=A0A1V9FYT0_9BACT|nr:deoxyribose-phosphate aldolase [Niastella vici]OQP63492.1 2-deoxyribose-5-phosphate aldolase [Niastella vici]
MNIAHYIDHTLLKPATTIHELKKLCEEALQYNFYAVCVPPPLVKNARSILANSAVKTATVIGFPFGYSVARAKLDEAQQAIQDGADELDVVINLIALRSKAWQYLELEMEQIVEAAHAQNRLVKVIIESGILTDEEIVKCCEIYAKVGVDFMKTSTGYAEKGATIEAVRLMRTHLPAEIKIKASGGIRTFEAAQQYIQAGANRLGTSSGVAIVTGSGMNGTSGY